MRNCGARYERPGGRERGDRIVKCDLPAKHLTAHRETVTGTWWPQRTETDVVDSDREMHERLTALGARTATCRHGFDWRSVCSNGCDDSTEAPPIADVPPRPLTDEQADQAIADMSERERRLALLWMAGAAPRDFAGAAWWIKLQREDGDPR